MTGEKQTSTMKPPVRSHRVYRVDLILTPEDRAELIALAVNRRNTFDDLYRWLTGKGYSVGRSSIARWVKGVVRPMQFEVDPGTLAGDDETLREKAMGMIHELGGEFLRWTVAKAVEELNRQRSLIGASAMERGE